MFRLKTILKEGKQELIEINKIRETTQKNMRKTIRFSKQAILSIHQKKFIEAKKFIENAKKIITWAQGYYNESRSSRAELKEVVELKQTD